MNLTYPVLITVGSILNFYGKHALVVGREFKNGILSLHLRTGSVDETLEITGEYATAKIPVKFLAQV